MASTTCQPRLRTPLLATACTAALALSVAQSVRLSAAQTMLSQRGAELRKAQKALSARAAELATLRKLLRASASGGPSTGLPAVTGWFAIPENASQAM